MSQTYEATERVKDARRDSRVESKVGQAIPEESEEDDDLIGEEYVGQGRRIERIEFDMDGLFRVPNEYPIMQNYQHFLVAVPYDETGE